MRHAYALYDPATGEIVRVVQAPAPLADGPAEDGLHRIALPSGVPPFDRRVVAGALVPLDEATRASRQHAAALGVLRAQRDRLLSKSDIAVLPDRWGALSDAQRAAWSTYRQALRDLPATTTDPTAPRWPDPPTF